MIVIESSFAALRLFRILLESVCRCAVCLSLGKLWPDNLSASKPRIDPGKASMTLENTTTVSIMLESPPRFGTICENIVRQTTVLRPTKLLTICAPSQPGPQARHCLSVSLESDIVVAPSRPGKAGDWRI